MNLDRISKPGPTVVAVSGGIDSCVLLHKLHWAALQVDADLIVAHVDHQLRQESGEDAEFVRELACEYGRSVVIKRIRVRKLNSVQAQARIQRYASIAQVAHLHGTRRIATGHHAQDQGENQAMKLAVGRFGDLEYVQELSLWNIEVWRPMLGLTRDEIESYARDHHLEWREDPSNASTAYTRNAVRMGGPSFEMSSPVPKDRLELRRLTAHRWWIDGHDAEKLRRACNSIVGVRITRKAIEECSKVAGKRVFTHGGVIIRHPRGFEIIRSTCQGDRALPAPPSSLESSLDFGKLEF